MLDWTPDGKALLFTSDRTGSLGLWSIAVVDGKPNGQPALLKTDIGKITSLGLSSKRTLYYSMATGVRGMERGIADIYTVSIDPNTLKPGSEPAPAAQRFLGTNSGADWSPDGKYLAYASKRGSVWQSPSALRFIRIALGRKLFFDKHLSSDETLSCASCHDPKLSFSDGGKVARGINGQEGTRNAPAIINRGYGRTFFWDGRVKSLEQQVLEPILNPKELGMTESLVESRTHLRIAGVTAALASFVRTIRSGDSPYDRYAAGNQHALDDVEKAGLAIFRGKGRCATCHAGPDLTDEAFHNTGTAWRDGVLHDPGRFTVSGKAEDRGAFKVPTLREVARTAPYMHDGSIPTLEDVVDYYDRGGNSNPNLDEDLRPLHLTAEEKSALVKFLGSLSGNVREGKR